MEFVDKCVSLLREIEDTDKAQKEYNQNVLKTNVDVLVKTSSQLDRNEYQFIATPEVKKASLLERVQQQTVVTIKEEEVSEERYIRERSILHAYFIRIANKLKKEEIFLQNTKSKKACDAEMKRLETLYCEFCKRNKFIGRGMFAAHIKEPEISVDIRPLSRSEIKFSTCHLTGLEYKNKYRLFYTAKTINEGVPVTAEISEDGQAVAQLLITFVNFEAYLKREILSFLNVPSRSIDLEPVMFTKETLFSYITDKTKRKGLFNLLNSFESLFNK